MEKLYLDMCCLKRPFDDQSQDRIRLETEAVILILEQEDRGITSLIGSAALAAENSLNPLEDRRQKVKELLDRFSEQQEVTPEVASRAAQLRQMGFKPFDALHILKVDRFERLNVRMFPTSPVASAAPQKRGGYTPPGHSGRSRRGTSCNQGTF